MGLFSSIGKAIGSVVGGITGSKSQAKAAERAGDLQYQAAMRGIDEQRRQFNLSREDQMPWLEAGETALGGIMDLLGLAPGGGGAEQQAEAIAALESSPLFQSLVRSGEEAILANASATGGLRGGNIQDALSNFRADTLSQVIQQQLSNLGGLSGTAVGSAQHLGGLGASYASNISNLLGQQGSIQSGALLGKAGVRNQQSNSLGGLIGEVLGGGDVLKGIGGILGGIF